MSRAGQSGPLKAAAARTSRLHVPALAGHPERPQRRFRPPRGRKLDLGCIRGGWRPSGTFGGTPNFWVVWSTRTTDWGAALSDFQPAAQAALLSECAWLDQAAGYPGPADL